VDPCSTQLAGISCGVHPSPSSRPCVDRFGMDDPREGKDDAVGRQTLNPTLSNSRTKPALGGASKIGGSSHHAGVASPSRTAASSPNTVPTSTARSLLFSSLSRLNLPLRLLEPSSAAIGSLSFLLSSSTGAHLGCPVPARRLPARYGRT
jgi:hypothetical protein